MSVSLSRAFFIGLLLAFAMMTPLSAQETRLLLVVGLGGDAEYRELFHGWATDLIAASTERLGVVADHIVYLGERPGDAPGVIADRSTKESMASALAEMARTAGPEDRILVVLIGHGTGQGEEVEFNLPGPDLTPQELDVMLSDFPTQTVGVVNTTPSSGPFVGVLSGPNRVILTATRTAQEKNETQFGAFFVEALREDVSDLDKDGRVSLLEAYQYAQREVERYYESQNLLATEHSLLDDDGDGEGSTELNDEATDGAVARTFWLGPGTAVAAWAPGPDSIADPELIRLYRKQACATGVPIR